NASANRINRAIARRYGDLGARTRITSDGANGDHAIIDFRHFLHEELGHELGVGTREENLRTTLFTTNVINISADAIAVAEHFAWDQFIATDDGFAATKVDDDVAIFNALNRTVDDFANTTLEFFEH